MSAITPRRVISVICQFFVHLQCHLPRKIDRIRDSEMLRKSVHEGKGRKSSCQTPLSRRILKQRVLDVFDWSSNCQIIARNLTQQLSLSLSLTLSVTPSTSHVDVLRAVLFFFSPTPPLPLITLACTCESGCLYVELRSFQAVLMCFLDTLGKRKTCDSRRKHVNCRLVRPKGFNNFLTNGNHLEGTNWKLNIVFRIAEDGEEMSGPIGWRRKRQSWTHIGNQNF